MALIVLDKLYKKGDKMKCVTLLNIAYKVLAIVFLGKTEIIGGYQCAFMGRRSSID